MRHLIDIQYDRNDMTLVRGTFRVRGDTLEIFPAYEEIAVRVEFFGDEVERIVEVDPLTGEIAGRAASRSISTRPSTSSPTRDKLARGDSGHPRRAGGAASERSGERGQAPRSRAARSSARCTTSRCCRRPATAPASRTTRCTSPGGDRASSPRRCSTTSRTTSCCFVDESHISLPQVRGMYAGDRARKDVLVDFGFRLPSALDNRPLTFDEFEQHDQPGRLRLGDARPLRDTSTASRSSSR